MDKKYIKPAIAGAIVVIVLVVLFGVYGAGEKFVRLGVITQNIVTSLANAPHGDPRPIEDMSVEYIKENTGSTAEVSLEELPKAFVPLKEYGHPPFNMGACNVCHAPKRSKPAAITTRTVADLCYKCHEPKAVIDERLEKLDCNKCHNPHHADRKELLRNKVTEKVCPVGDFH